MDFLSVNDILAKQLEESRAREQELRDEAAELSTKLSRAEAHADKLAGELEGLRAQHARELEQQREHCDEQLRLLRGHAEKQAKEILRLKGLA